MSLRRTALKRRAELRRSTPIPRARRARAARASGAIATQRRNTGPTAAVRRTVAQRAGYCCEVCGLPMYVVDVGWTTPHSFHHRQPRGMGGTSRDNANSPANLLLVCGTGTTGCHGRIEANRHASLEAGLLVRQAGSPDVVVVTLRVGTVLLTHEGTYEEVA